jgi:hypothetical protein
MKAKILPIRALKLGPTQFQTGVEHLQAEGRMPSFAEKDETIKETCLGFAESAFAGI